MMHVRMCTHRLSSALSHVLRCSSTCVSPARALHQQEMPRALLQYVGLLTDSHCPLPLLACLPLQPPRTSKRWPHRRDAVSHRVMVRVHHLQLPRASPLPATELQPCTLPGALPHAAAVDALHCMRCAPPFILFLHASPQKTVLSFILTLRPSTFPFLCLRQRRGSRAFIFQGCPCVPCRCPSISLLILLLIS